MSDIETLDNEIGDLRSRIATLRAHCANLSSILLSQPHLSTRLEQRPVQHERNRRNATKIVQKQATRNLENVYRACAGITAFKVKDPDPYAVDHGNVLGVRIEVSIGGQFVETYTVLFNRPSKQHRHMLRIHKHTIPTCIPLQALANRWLPVTRKNAEKVSEQNLIKFGKALRKELVSWHLRLEAIDKLRCEAGLVDTAARNGEAQETSIGKVLNAFVSDDSEDGYDEEEQRLRNGPLKILDIEADAAGREVTVTWTNGRVGVMKVTKDGEVEKAIVKNDDGTRDAMLSRKAIGRIEGLVHRLAV